MKFLKSAHAFCNKLLYKFFPNFLSEFLSKFFHKFLSKFSEKHLAIAKQLTLLASACLIFIFLLFTLTKSRVHNNEVAYLRASLSRVLPENIALSDFDNDVLESKRQFAKNIIYPACSNGKLHYALVEFETDKGYSGLIRLLANVDVRTQRVIAVRPLFHQETPGLGDQIDTDKSDWLTQFDLPLKSDKKLAVDKDGGDIDSIAGATITSRAVTNAIADKVFNFDIQTSSSLCSQQ